MIHDPQLPEIVHGSTGSGLADEYARGLLGACDGDGAPTGKKRAPDERDALEWARSGAMALSGPDGSPPRFAPGPLASAAQGTGAVIEQLAPGARWAGRDWAALLGERAAIAGLERAGQETAGGSGRLLQTGRGWLALNLPREDDWRLIPAWLETSMDPPEAGDDRSWRRIAALLADRDAAELVERARLMGLAAAPAPSRIIDERPFFLRRLESERGHEGSDPSRPRVLDLSTLWAGPLAGALLAEAGADVLKVESPARPDGARSGPAAFFDLVNQGKQGAALDLRSPADRPIFERLLESADIVLESARPRALSQLGYDAQSWVAARAGRLWVSITGYGRDQEWVAFGDDAGVAAGLAWSPGARAPSFCADAVADPLTGLHVAALILWHRSQGRGGLLDVSLRDVAARAARPAALQAPLEVERGPQGWRVVGPDGPVDVAAPRARAVRGRAPALCRPSPARVDAWTRDPC
jgi:hypothetical protein